MLMNEGGYCEGGTRRGWRHGSQATCHLHAISITHRVRRGRTAAGPTSGYMFRDAVIGANRLLGQVRRHARAPIDSRAACTAPAARLGCTGAVVGFRHLRTLSVMQSVKVFVKVSVAAVCRPHCCVTYA